MNTTTMTEMHHQLAAVTAERDHWKANHDNRVNAAKILMDRTDMPLERIGAYKHYVAALEANQKLRELAESDESEILAVREDNHSMMLEIDGLRTERDRLAAELENLREQKPVAYLDYWKSDGTGIVRKQRTTGVPFYNSPVPAPATECRGIPGRGCQYLAACNMPCNKCGKVHNAMFSLTPTPFIPDDDTRRNDAEFAAQQEVGNAPSVPDEWRTMLQWLIGQRGKAGHCHSRPGVWDDDNGDKAGQPCEQCAMYDRARVLLQSADHSEQTPEKVAPDCRTCANRGRINGLSQESYCDSCVYEGRGWRQNHFVDARKMVDAVKRRCEACAILPCSCK